MQKEANRRFRSQNWINQDKIILRDLIKERIYIISHKNTDSITNRKKEKAWDDVLYRFNKVCIGTTRTLSQIKAQWGIMKMNANKKAEKRKGLTSSGDELPPSSQPESVDIPIWLPIEVKIETEDSDMTYSTNEQVSIVSTPDIPGAFRGDEVKSENPESPLDVKREKPASPVQRRSSVDQNQVLCNDSNERWWCSDSNDNGINNSDVSVSANDGIKRKKQNKKTVGSFAAQSPAAQVAAVETECRRELHKMQMKVASFQVANEEHKSRILHLEEVLHSTKIEYYKRKMLFYNRNTKGVEESE